MVNFKRFVTLFFVFTIGCTPIGTIERRLPSMTPPSSDVTILSLPTATERPTQTPTKTQMATLTPSQSIKTTTPTMTPAIPAQARFTFQCADFLTIEERKNLSLSGYAVLIKSVAEEAKKTYLLDLENLVESPLIEESGWKSIFESISPDGNWLAYKKYGGTEDFLIVQDVNGAVETKLSWQDDWLELKGWINNHTLLVSKMHSSYFLDPFTSTENEIQNNFPDLANLIGVGSDYWGPAVFSPNLDLAVYSREPGEQGLKRIVLWDLQKKEAVEYLSSLGDPFGVAPVWSTNGAEFAMSLRNIDTTWAYDNFIQELYVISRGGEITQITNLAAYSPRWVFVKGYTWSPDASQIAFWVNYSFDLRHNTWDYQGLAIAEVSERKTRALCLENASQYEQLVWSRDGRGVLMFSWYEGSVFLVWVDMLKNEATPLASDYFKIIGWMQSR